MRDVQLWLRISFRAARVVCTSSSVVKTPGLRRSVPVGKVPRA